MAFLFQIGQQGNNDLVDFAPENIRGNVPIAEPHIGSGWPGNLGDVCIDFGDTIGFNNGPPYVQVTPTGYFRVRYQLSNGAVLDTGLRQVERGLIVGVHIAHSPTPPAGFNVIWLNAHYVDGGIEQIAGPVTLPLGTSGVFDTDTFFWYGEPPPSDRPPHFTIPTGSPTSVPIPIITSGPDGPVPNPGGGPGNTPEDKGGGPGSGWPGDPNTLVGGTAWRDGWYVDTASGNYIVVSS